MRADHAARTLARANQYERRAERALIAVMQHGAAVQESTHPAHYQWLLDQVVRELTGTEDEYRTWVDAFAGESESDVPHYRWSSGRSPWTIHPSS